MTSPTLKSQILHSSVDLLGFFSGGLQKSVLVHFPRFSWAGLWIQGLLCAGTAPGSGTWEDWEIQAGSSSVALIPKRDSPQILSAQPLANYLHYFSPSFTHLAWKQSHAQLWFFGITSQGCSRDLALFGIVISICPPPKQLLMIFIPIKHWHSLGASPWFQILCIWFWLWLPDFFFVPVLLFCASLFLQQVTFSCCCFSPHRPKPNEVPWELVLVTWGVWNVGQTVQD